MFLACVWAKGNPVEEKPLELLWKGSCCFVFLRTRTRNSENKDFGRVFGSWICNNFDIVMIQFHNQ